MKDYEDNHIQRLGVALPLMVAILLFSIVSHSADFHQWFHGDDVDCALIHSPGGQGTEEDSSEDSDHHHDDPLQCFCQTGYLFQGGPEAQMIEPPRVFRSASQAVVSCLSRRGLSSRPTRAPPVLV